MNTMKAQNIMNNYSVFLQLNGGNDYTNNIVCIQSGLTSSRAYYLCAELNKKQPGSYFFKCND